MIVEDIKEDLVYIYKIMNTITGSIYINSCTNLKEEVDRVYNDLESNIYSNTQLQQDYNKYGNKAFNIEIICKCNVKYLKLVKSILFKELDCTYNRYSNIQLNFDTTPKPVCINGVKYNSISSAQKALKLSTGCIYKRLNSKNFPNYYYIDEINKQ